MVWIDIPFSVAAPLVGGLLAATVGFDAIDAVAVAAYLAAGVAGATVVRLLRRRPTRVASVGAA